MFKNYLKASLIIVATMLIMACGLPEVDGHYEYDERSGAIFKDGVVQIYDSGETVAEHPYTVDGDVLSINGVKAFKITAFGLEGIDTKKDRLTRVFKGE